MFARVRWRTLISTPVQVGGIRSAGKSAAAVRTSACARRGCFLTIPWLRVLVHLKELFLQQAIFAHRHQCHELSLKLLSSFTGQSLPVLPYKVAHTHVDAIKEIAMGGTVSRKDRLEVPDIPEQSIRSRSCNRRRIALHHEVCRSEFMIVGMISLDGALDPKGYRP